VIPRQGHVDAVEKLLKNRRVVAVLGARQVGKTSLAQILERRTRNSVHYDLEDSRDLARLSDPMLALAGARGLVVLDEIQRRPELFPALRVLADSPRGARFLVLGSASGDLLRQSSESLAGRIAYHVLPPLQLDEVGLKNADRLWLRGGFPRSYTAQTNAESANWRRDFIRTFLERDLPQLGVRIAAASLQRFWAMLAHWHGQTMNWSELGRSMGVTDHVVRSYLDLLQATFMVRVLPPWHENLSKRQVKAPKAYVADTGLLHTLLDVDDQRQLERHPKVGASWEGFCIDAILRQLRARHSEAYFWATHAGAELDLFVVRGKRRLGFEVKRTSSPALTASMTTAVRDLNLERLDVIHAGTETFPLAAKVRAVPLRRLLDDVRRLK
jgi:uncharacterized protein